MSPSGWTSLRAGLVGNYKLLRFWFEHVLDPFRQLPEELYDEGALEARRSAGKAFELSVPRRYADGYEAGLRRLAMELEELNHGLADVGFHTKQVLFWMVRMATVAAAVHASVWATFWTSLLQFVALPYSFAVALSYGLETVLTLYTGPLLVFPALTWLSWRFLPVALNPTLTISREFLIAFFLADQAFCTLCLFWTPDGKPAHVSLKRILQSVCYGFLNCKTYWLVLLPVCFGLEAPLLPWILDAALGLSERITNRMRRYWQVLFYHVHRIGHLKYVYPDAHKFHHFLHDTTAFDAHVFGSGAPEEWLILMTDFLFASCGVLPASLTFSVLRVSWLDKWALHTRWEKPDYDEANFHADHHARHRVNFGFNYPYELLMRTASPELGDKAVWGGFHLTRLQDEHTVKLSFSPVGDVNKEVPASRTEGVVGTVAVGGG